MIVSATSSFAYVIAPYGRMFVRHGGIGFVNVPNNFTAYSEPDINSEVLAQIDVKELANSNVVDAFERLNDIVVFYSPAKKEENSKESVLSSLNTIFSSKNKQDEAKVVTKKKEPSLKTSKKKAKVGKIMPTEMRLSFQPNRAEISGQTLRWIQAFAVKAANDRNTAIEIRIDGTSSMKLQQKRLNLLHNILTNKGVEYSKINTVFTDREPNSFIIRTITLSSFNPENNINTNSFRPGYYLQW